MSDITKSDITKIAEKTLQQAGHHSVVIGNKSYTIELLPATTALVVATELFKVCLPAFAAYGDSARKEGLVLPEEDNVFTESAMLLVSQMDKLSVLEVVETLTKKVYADSLPVDVDKEFKGNVGGLLMLLEFILRQNIGPLFQDWLAAKGISLPFSTSPTQNKED